MTVDDAIREIRHTIPTEHGPEWQSVLVAIDRLRSHSDNGLPLQRGVGKTAAFLAVSMRRDHYRAPHKVYATPDGDSAGFLWTYSAFTLGLVIGEDGAEDWVLTEGDKVTVKGVSRGTG